MSIPTQGGKFSYAPQAQKYGDHIDKYDPTALSWYSIRAPRVSVGAQQMQENLAPETGGPIVPNGAYKTMSFVAGDVETTPRLENAMMYLLYGALGKHQSWADSAYNPADPTTPVAGSTGTFLHKFSFDPTNTYMMPWMSVRKMIPGSNAKSTYGEIGVDVKVASLSLQIPGAGLLSANIGFQGRVPKFPSAADVNAWTYANANEDSLSIPHAGRGTFLIGGEKFPVVNAAIDIQNGLSQPQQEMIVGEYHPDDMVALTRTATIRVTYKWSDDKLYRELMTGAVDGVDWDSIPMLRDTNGETRALEAYFESPGNIPGSNPKVPNSLRVIANRVVWQIEGNGIELQAGNIIQVTLTGTVLEPETGQDYIEIWMQNGVDLTWHTAPEFAFGDATVTFTEGTGPIDIDNTATLTSSLVDFNGGQVIITPTANNESADIISVANIGTGAGEIGNTAGAITYGGLAIGDVDATNDGTAGKPLQIDLNTADTSPAAVEALLQALQFDTGASPAETTRVLEYYISDGDQGFTVDTVRIAVNATT